MQLSTSLADLMTISWQTVLISASISLALGLFISLMYRLVTPSVNYSVAIHQTLLYVAMITSLVMLIISNQLARAFTLVGALSVIRFRTPVKDTRDASFVFLSLAAGMGTGVGLYLETAVGIGFIGLAMVAMRLSRLGMKAKGEVLVKFTISGDGEADGQAHRDVFDHYLKDHRLINTRTLGSGGRLELTFLVKPLRGGDLVRFSKALSSIEDLDRIAVIVCDDEGLTQNVF
jgi:Domain of unknown function (DUF4956)